jgi:hypothetical protein
LLPRDALALSCRPGLVASSSAHRPVGRT